MAVWSYVHALRDEHAAYLAELGVEVPPLSPRGRAPERADVEAAYVELEAVESDDLVVDVYPSTGDSALTVALRGSVRRSLAFVLALARRCGPLYVVPFPHDAAPGIVADPADDLAGLLRRMDPETRASVEAALRAGH